MGDPQPLATGKFEKNPALIRISEYVRITAIGKVAITFDERHRYIDGLTRCFGALQDNSRYVAIVQSVLGLWRHFHEFLPRKKRHISYGNAIFIQTPVCQWRGQPEKKRIIHR